MTVRLTPREMRTIEAAEAIRAREPALAETAYVTACIVQATLPHR